MKTARILALLAATSLASIASASSAIYLTSAMGRSSSNVPVPKEYLANVSELSAKSNYVSLGLGLQVTDFLAIEMSYFEISADEVRATYNAGTDMPYSASYGSRVEGLQAVAKPGFKIAERVTIFGLAGLCYESQKAGTTQLQLVRMAVEESKGFQPVFGFGVDVRIWQQLMLGLEYRYLDLKLGRAHIVAARLGWQF